MICSSVVEATQHMFFDRPFAHFVRSWLSTTFHYIIDVASVRSIFSICEESWVSQTKDVISSAIVNSFWTIWHCRNNLHFNNKTIFLWPTSNIIFANVSLTSHMSNMIASTSIEEFVILYFFSIFAKSPKVPIIKEVHWLTPSFG